MKRIKEDSPSPLQAIMGTHRSPSTWDVISMCHKTDRMLKDAEVNSAIQAWQEEIQGDLEAILEQIDWLWDCEEFASSEKAKDEFVEAIGFLLSLYEEIQAEHRLRRPKGPAPPTIGELLYVPLAYALQVLLNVVLYVIFTVIMMAVVLVAVFLFFKAL